MYQHNYDKLYVHVHVHVHVWTDPDTEKHEQYCLVIIRYIHYT